SAAIMEPRFDFDLAELATTARQAGDHFVLNGAKCFVPLADEAEIIVVLAQVTGSSALGAFVLERGTAGLSMSEREANMGLKALPSFEIGLDNVRVPAASRLGGEQLPDMTPFLNRTRIALAASAVGVSRAAFDYARDYAKERKAFGVAIAQK